MRRTALILPIAAAITAAAFALPTAASVSTSATAHPGCFGWVAPRCLVITPPGLNYGPQVTPGNEWNPNPGGSAAASANTTTAAGPNSIRWSE